MDNKKDNDFKELTDSERQNSTVFCDPNVQNKKPPKNKRGFSYYIPIILVPVVILAIIASSLWLYKNYAGRDVTGSSESTTEAKIVNVTKYEETDVKSISLKNGNGTFDFYKKSRTVKSESGSAQETVWYIKDIKEKFTDTEATSLTVEDCRNCTAIMKQAVKKDNSYGFDNPDAEISIILNDGKEVKLTIGHKFNNSNLTGTYAKVSTDRDHVYLLSGEAADYYVSSTKDYISAKAGTMVKKTSDNAEYFDSTGVLQSFDYIKFSGKMAKYDYEFRMYGKENSSINYRMVAPYEYNVDNEKFVNVKAVITDNLETSGIYAFDNDKLSEKQIAKFGLDKPDALLSYSVNGEKVNIKLKQSKSDKNFYSMIVNNDPVIYKVTRNSFDFLEYDYCDFVSSGILLENIEGIKAIDYIIDNDKKYTFDIHSVKTKSDDSSEPEVQTKVKYEGKKINSDNFSTFYSYALYIAPYLTNDSLIAEKPSGATEHLKIVIHHNSDINDEDVVMTVYKLKNNKLRYYVMLDGKSVGLCDKAYVDKITDSMDEVIRNITLEEEE